MEGWDGFLDGRPTELTMRRWKWFGLSVAKLIWDGEATAVRRDGRANPNQVMISDKTVGQIARLHELLVRIDENNFGRSDDLLIGLHSLRTRGALLARINVKSCNKRFSTTIPSLTISLVYHRICRR